MAAFDRIARAVGITLACVSACVPPISESGRPCPCAPSYVCCEATGTCQAIGDCPRVSPASDAASSDRLSGGAPGDEVTREADRIDAPSSAFDASPSEAEPSGDVAIDFEAQRAEASANDVSVNDVSVNDVSVSDASAEVVSVTDVASKNSDASDANVSRSDAADASLVDAAVARDGSSSNECWAGPRKSNVLVMTYDPYLVDKGHGLRADIAGWQDPEFLSVRLAEHIRNASQGSVNYDIVEFRTLDAWPKQMPDSAPLNETTFFQGPPAGSFTDYEGGNADYLDMFNSQDLCTYVTEHDVSEIWIWQAAWGAMTFGFDDFAYRLRDDKLAGRPIPDGDGALYMRRRKNMPDCHRSLWVMGWLYTNGFDPRLYNIRIEEIMGLFFRALPVEGGTGPFALFSQYALAWPDDVQVGTPAFPPNGGVGLAPEQQAWDYSNRSIVSSAADDWYGYPSLTGAKKLIDCTAWGCSGDGFQAWYAAHVPHAFGGSFDRGCNNWWQYFVDSDGTLPSCTGDACSSQYATGSPCTVDDQCASHHCSCQGARMLCSDASGPVCPSPNWDPCSIDQDCLSGVCGCNLAPPPKVCLPDVRYPRDCTGP